MSTILTARRLLQHDTIVEYPVVTIEDGHIVSIESREGQSLPSQLRPASAIPASAVHSYPEATLVPCFLDIHVHGAAGHDVMEGTPQALRAVGAFLASRGVGAFLPTTVTSTEEETLRSLAGLADAIEETRPTDGATPIGVHLEGPFLSHAKRGVHSAASLRLPAVPLFERFWQASRGHIRLMTIAPELEGAAELIAHASARGVRCSLGHSDATAAQAEVGFHAGASSATHTLNAMRALTHREPGIAGYVLDNDDLFAEMICDGIHVDPAMVRLFFKAKGSARAILITDGISATGMPDGTYRLGDLEVQVEGGRCTLAGPVAGILAGSVLTLDQAVRNFASFTRSGIPESVRLVTRNPAKLLGVEKDWGVLEAGRQADLLALSTAGEVIAHFRAGQQILNRTPKFLPIRGGIPA